MIGKRAAQTAVRLARVVLRRAGIGAPAAAPHRPAFDEQALAARLEVRAPDALKVSSSAPSHLAYAGARRARQLIGPRFFVNPERIAELSVRLHRERPIACTRLLAQVRADLDKGLPVYASRGGVLGTEFPWSDLPVGPGEDRMYAKRPHRFSFVPRHAWACLEWPGAATTLRGMLESWMRHAEEGSNSLCYDSNLGVFQRLLALLWGWAFLAARSPVENADGLGLEWLIWRLIEADVRYLEPLLGDSFPNNHLLADRFAAWFLATLLPEMLDECPSDVEQRWCEELLAQTYPDGGSFEHSSHYHEFASEMSAAYLVLAGCNGLKPDPAVRKRTRALLAYQCALTGPEAEPLPIGNAAEDTLFPLDGGEGWCSGSLREFYRGLFDAGIPPTPRDDQSALRAFWLLGGQLPWPEEGGTTDSLPTDFPQAGLYIMSDDHLESRLVFRTGPSPESRIAAGHMHADLLAIYLQLRGLPLLVDSGTFSYRGRDAVWKQEGHNWRRYFASPSAHNGLVLEGEDPLGGFSGDFRPRETSTCAIVTRASSDLLSYVDSRIRSSNVYDGVRRAVIHVSGEYWLILDSIPGGKHQCGERWFGFQCAANVEVTIEKRNVALGLSGKPPEAWIVSCERLHAPQLLRGSYDPLGGWIAPRYGERVAASQLRYQIGPDADNGAFVIHMNGQLTDAVIRHSVASNDDAQLIVVEGHGMRDWLVYQPKGSAVWDIGEERLQFKGRLLWLRLYERGGALLRWQSGTALTWMNRGIDVHIKGPEPVDLSIDRATAGRELESLFSRFQWPF